MRRRFGRKAGVSEQFSSVHVTCDDAPAQSVESAAESAVELTTTFTDNLVDPASRQSVRIKARNSAIRLLARREHAQAEIKQKLQFRGYDESLAAEVVDDLTRQRLLSDERFAEMFIRSRAARGQGAVRLRAELRQLKLSPELIESRMRAAEVDWTRLARDTRQRKFGQTIPKIPAERAKQMRFLQYRGFTADQIRLAMGASFEEDHLLDAGEADPALASDPN